jgi:hypothetical protein
MFIIPGSAMSSAEIDACTCVLETNIVGRFKPFHLTTDPCLKFVPVTVSVKPAPPASAEDGLRLVTLGTGLGAGLTIENGSEFESPPPGGGLDTATLAVPGTAISAAVMDARSSERDMNVVLRFELFHRTTDPGTKPAP